MSISATSIAQMNISATSIAQMNISAISIAQMLISLAPTIFDIFTLKLGLV